MEILSTFYARVKYIYVRKIHHSNQWGGEKISETALSLRTPGASSNTRMPKPLPLTTPADDSSIGLRTFTQYARKSPLVTMGRPHSPPKLPLPFDDLHPYPSSDATHHPKRHPDPVSRFATVHFPDRPTDRQTDRQMGYATNLWNERLRRCIVLIQSDALIIVSLIIFSLEKDDISLFTLPQCTYNLYEHCSSPLFFFKFVLFAVRFVSYICAVFACTSSCSRLVSNNKYLLTYLLS